MREQALAKNSPYRLPAMTIGVRGSEGKIPPSVRRTAVCGGRRSGAGPWNRGGAIVEGSWRPDVPRSRDEWPSAAPHAETTTDLGTGWSRWRCRLEAFAPLDRCPTRAPRGQHAPRRCWLNRLAPGPGRVT